MALTRYQQTARFQGTPMDMTQARGAETLAQRLSAFAARKEQEFARAETLQQQQFDKAYLDGIENDVIRDMGRLATDHETDFDQFTVLAQENKTATIEQIEDPAMKERASVIFDRKLLQYGEQVYRKTNEFRIAQQSQIAQDDIKLHSSDTQNMISTAIRHGMNMDPEKFKEALGTSIDDQRLYIANKLDNMPGLTTKAGLEKRSKMADQVRLDLYQAAVVERAMIEEETGGNGASVLFNFTQNPTDFFKNDPVLSAIFPEDLPVISEDEQNTMFLEGMKIINAHRDNEEYMQTQKDEEQQQVWADHHTTLLMQIAQNPKLDWLPIINNYQKENWLGNKEYESLLKIVQAGTLFKEDDNLVSEIWTNMYDPSFDQFAIYDQIQNGAKHGQISPSMQLQMLNTLRDGSLRDVTRNEDYKLAFNSIDDMRTTGPLQAFNTDESARITKARFELYQRTREGENPLEIIDEIKNKYRKSTTKPTTATWNTAWIGSADEPDQAATEKTLATQFKNKQISFEQYSREIEALEAFMKSYNLRQSR